MTDICLFIVEMMEERIKSTQPCAQTTTKLRVSFYYRIIKCSPNTTWHASLCFSHQVWKQKLPKPYAPETIALFSCFTHPVKDGRPALLRDALKHCQHSKTNIIKGRDTIVGPDPQLQAGGDFRITDVGTRGGIRLVFRRVTRRGHLSLSHYLICKDTKVGQGRMEMKAN